MKIAHLSQTDSGAGAGRAAYRIHRSLLAMGADSAMFVGEKRGTDDTVHCVAGSSAAHFKNRVCQFLEAKLAARGVSAKNGLFSPARFGYFNPASDARVRAADIACLYWINGGFILPEKLARLKQPIVWRLSDVWPFTGGCHYPGSCERYTQHCGHCPQLMHPGEQDLSRRLFMRKQKAWQALDLTIAAPSEWIAGLARKSALFSGRRIEVIPTGVDIDTYRPLDRATSRARFNIPPDKIVIMFAAMDSSDPRKGYALLHGALEKLAAGKFASKLLTVVFGDPNLHAALPLPSLSLGRLHDDAALAAAYSSADLMVVPSLEDNLPNVALEAIACGAPVVGFNVCGMPDIVRHGSNGALAASPDAGLLAAEIEQLLENADLRLLSANARAHAIERFSLTRQAESYMQLYRELVAGGGMRAV